MECSPGVTASTSRTSTAHTQRITRRSALVSPTASRAIAAQSCSVTGTAATTAQELTPSAPYAVPAEGVTRTDGVPLLPGPGRLVATAVAVEQACVESLLGTPPSVT